MLFIMNTEIATEKLGHEHLRDYLYPSRGTMKYLLQLSCHVYTTYVFHYIYILYTLRRKNPSELLRKHLLLINFLIYLPDKTSMHTIFNKIL
jgi:hypothetical protein